MLFWALAPVDIALVAIIKIAKRRQKERKEEVIALWE
jgi:hypothetical protein